MLGFTFFEVGAFYQVMTHRPDTHHTKHWYETGEIVKCIDVTPIGKNRTLCGHKDFRKGNLTGLFINDKGIEQELSTGDVRKCRLA